MIKIELTQSETKALLQVIEAQQKVALQRRDTAQEITQSYYMKCCSQA